MYFFLLVVQFWLPVLNSNSDCLGRRLASRSSTHQLWTPSCSAAAAAAAWLGLLMWSHVYVKKLRHCIK